MSIIESYSHLSGSIRRPLAALSVLLLGAAIGCDAASNHNPGFIVDDVTLVTGVRAISNSCWGMRKLPTR